MCFARNKNLTGYNLSHFMVKNREILCLHTREMPTQYFERV
jgi:hypothetical protein